MEDRTLLATIGWDGGGTTDNWSDADNWSTNTLPTAGDDVVFDAGDTAVIDDDFSIAGITISGGSVAFEVGGHTLSVGGDWTVSGGAFTAADSTVEFVGSPDKTIDHGGAAFNNVRVAQSLGANLSIAGTPITVNGDLSFDSLRNFVGGEIDVNGGDFSIGDVLQFRGVVRVDGNVTTADSYVQAEFGGRIVLDGTNQSVDAIGSFGALPGLEFDASGTVAVGGNGNPVGVSGDWNHESGIVDVQSQIEFIGQATKTIDHGGFAFNDVRVGQSTGAHLTVTGSPMQVNGDLAFDSMRGFLGGEIDLNGGDFSINEMHDFRGIVRVDGNVTTGDTYVQSGFGGRIVLDGANHSVEATGPFGALPGLEFAAGGTVVVGGNGNTVGVSGDWNHESGIVDVQSQIEFIGQATKTIDHGGFAFNDVRVGQSAGAHLTVTGSPMQVNGDLAFDSMRGFLGGEIDLNGGDFSITEMHDFRGIVRVDGNVTTGDTYVQSGFGGRIVLDSTNHSVEASAAFGALPGLEFSASGTVTVGGNLNPIGISGDWLYQSGTVDVQTDIEFIGQASKTIDAAGFAFNNVTVNQSSGADLTVIGTPVEVNGDLAFDNLRHFLAGEIDINGGNYCITEVTVFRGVVRVDGDVTTTDTLIDAGFGGRVLLDGHNQSVESPVAFGALPGVEFAATGTVTVGGNLNMLGVSGDWRYQSGFVDVQSAIEFIGGSSKSVDGGGFPFRDVAVNQSTGVEFSVVNTPMLINGNFSFTSLRHFLAGEIDINGGDLAIVAMTGFYGVVRVDGDVTTGDTSIVNDAAGRIIFDGLSAQLITSTVTGGQLPHLEIDSGCDGGIVRLGSDVEANELTVTHGMIDLAGYVITIGGTGNLNVEPNGTLVVHLDAVPLIQADVGGNVTFQHAATLVADASGVSVTDDELNPDMFDIGIAAGSVTDLGARVEGTLDASSRNTQFILESVPLGPETLLRLTGTTDAAEIHGLKFHDLDADGVFEPGDGEVGLPGWTIFLDLNANGILDAGEPSTVTMADDPATTCIDETGMYWLVGLEAGSYLVSEVLQSGWAQTLPGLPTLTHSVTLADGEVLSGIDFGNAQVDTFVSVDTGGSLVITDVAGGDSDDALTIQADAVNGQYVISDPNLVVGTNIVGASGSPGHSIRVPFSAVTGSDVLVETLDGDDVLTVDYSLGDFSKSIRYDAGDPVTAPGDSLVLTGGIFADAIFGFIDATSGTVDLTGNATLSYANIEPITSSVTAASVTLNYGVSSETITISDAGSGQTTVTSTAGETVTFVNPTNALTVNGGDGGDLINLASLAPNYPAAVVLDGQGGFDDVGNGGSITLATNRDFSMIGDRVFQANSVSLQGTGGVSLIADRNIWVYPGSAITTEDGPIALEANLAATGTGNFSGIEVRSATISSVNGPVSLSGRGGTAGTFNIGVHVLFGALVSSQSGAITIDGTGGTGTQVNDGVRVAAGGATVLSQDGDIRITGQGGNGADFSIGVLVAFDARVASSGAAEIIVNGLAGSGTGHNHRGVELYLDGVIESDQSDISISGIGGGTLSNSWGVSVMNGSRISARGDGNVSIEGTGTDGTNQNPGVVVGSFIGTSPVPSIVSTVDGDISIVGQAGDGDGEQNTGIKIDEGSEVQADGDGRIVLHGTGGSGTTNANGVRVTGGSSVRAAQADVGIVGVAGPGTEQDNAGVLIEMASTVVTDGTGGITIEGTGGTGSDLNHGIAVTGSSTVSAADGDVRLTGTGGDGTTGGDVGVGILAGGIVSTSAAGHIFLNGTGGLAGQGVLVRSSGLVRTTGAGHIDVVGSATAGQAGIEATGIDAGSNSVTLTAPAGVIREAEPGTDVAGSVTTIEGEVAPGGIGPASQMVIESDVDFGSEDSFSVDLNGLIAVSEYDQLQITGVGQTVGLGEATLNVSLTFVPNIGDEFVIIDLIASDVVGIFDGLPEGTNFVVNTTNFRITYEGGDDNDVVLIVNGPPTQPVDTNPDDNLIPEGSANGTPVGVTAFSSDPDGDVVTYALLDDAGGRFAIDPVTGVVAVADVTLLDGDDTHSITVEARDSWGAFATADFLIVVANVAPVIEGVAGPDLESKGNATEPITVSGQFSDAGIPDTHSVTIDWGDGSAPEAATVDQAADTFDAAHTYVDGGLYTVTITVADDDGAAVIETTTAVISGVGLHGGTLYVVGTDGRDHVRVGMKRVGHHHGHHYHHGGGHHHGGTSVLKVDAKLNQGSGQQRIRKSFDPSEIDRIVVIVCAGNDHVDIHNGHGHHHGGHHGHGNAVTIPSLILGGAGRDHLKGGAGNDVIVGGPGRDKIFGRDGADVLIGGTGRDDLHGGRGEDVLIGGSTVHDNDLNALDDIYHEWTSTASYLDRVNHLRAGSGSTGIRLAAGIDVFDDGDRDKLRGCHGLDWYLGDGDGVHRDDDWLTLKPGEEFDQIPD